MKGTDRTTIIVALIGGIFVLLAAVIGLFTPITSRLADRLLSEPTPTVAPTATATLTPLPAPTLSPTVTNTVPPPTATWTAVAPTILPTPTHLPTLVAPQGSSVQFVLVNNDITDYSFFIDGAFATDIGSGTVLVFDAPRGTHQLETCPVDTNPVANVANCDSVRYDVDEDPFDWMIQGDAKPTGDVTLVLMNTATVPVDIYVDGRLERSLPPNRYYLFTTSPGKHTIQNCPAGVTPEQTDSNCNDTADQNLIHPIELWKVTD